MKYITKYITNHNMNRDLEMKIHTFTETGSYVASIGIPGTVFGFLHLFYCIACGSQGVPVATNCSI